MGVPSNRFLAFSLVGAVFALCVLGFAVYVSNLPSNIEASNINVVNNTKERVIIMNEKGFNPQQIIISAGDQVTWKNSDLGAHQIVSSLGSTLDNLSQFNEKLEKGESVSFVFEKSGVFHYFDKLNSRFSGEVIVK